MSQTARKPNQSGTTVTVINAHRRIENGANSRRIFGGAEVCLTEFLEGRQIHGVFKLHAIEAIKGSSAAKGVHPKFVDNKRVKVSIQHGSNDTGWAYWLHPPEEMSAELLLSLMKAPAPRKNQETPRPVQLAAPPTPAPKVPAPNPVREFLECRDTIAVAIRDCFPKLDAYPPPSVIIDAVAEEMKWSLDLARQAFNGLLNRNYLVESPLRGVNLVAVKDEALCERLRLLDALKKPPAAKNTPGPQAVSPKAMLRAQLDGVCRGKVVDKPLNNNAKEEVIVPAATTTDPSAGLAKLSLMSDQFTAAQALLRQKQATSEELLATKARLLRELAEADAQLADLERKHADASSIVANPDYSNAATKVAQIRAIMDA